MTKTCTKCGETKGLDEFHRKRAARDGRYPSCKACRAAHARQWYAANSERVREYGAVNRERRAEYREANRERFAEGGRKWRKDNLDKHAANERNRRARKRNADGNHTAEEFQALCDQYGNRCLACGRDDVSLTADHVIPLIRGGSNDIGNIQVLCGPCNSKKGVRTTDYR